MKQDEHILYLMSQYKNPAFIDENGLGSIFGEHTACAVQPNGYFDSQVNDSKKIKHEKIYQIAKRAIKNIQYGFGIVLPKELNRIKNMHRANKLAMIRAVEALPIKPDALFIDGKFNLPESNIENYSIIKGDTKVFGIALASIIGKYLRDKLIREKYLQNNEKYDIFNNVGYRSPRHLIGIRIFGLTKFHRTWMNQIKRVISGSYDTVIMKKYFHIWKELSGKNKI